VPLFLKRTVSLDGRSLDTLTSDAPFLPMIEKLEAGVVGLHVDDDVSVTESFAA
jgi:hypothetical protein